MREIKRERERERERTIAHELYFLLYTRQLQLQYTVRTNNYYFLRKTPPSAANFVILSLTGAIEFTARMPILRNCVKGAMELRVGPKIF